MESNKEYSEQKVTMAENVEARRERQRRYREKNRERLRDYWRDRKREHRRGVVDMKSSNTSYVVTIYGILSKDHVGDHVNSYIGSTGRNLYTRMHEHLKCAQQGVARKLYDWARAIGTENVDVVVLDRFVCTNPDEQFSREDYFVQLIKPTLNAISVRRCRTVLDNIKESDDDYDAIKPSTSAMSIRDFFHLKHKHKHKY